MVTIGKAYHNLLLSYGKNLNLCLVVARQLEGICRCQWPGHKKVKVNMEVYSLVCSISASLLALRNYSLVRGPCSPTSHLNSSGTYSLAATTFGRMTNHTHRSLLGPSRHRHLLLGREGARVCKGFAQENSVNSKFSPASDQTRDLSLACRARYH